jgi:hypothetical protein
MSEESGENGHRVVTLTRRSPAVRDPDQPDERYIPPPMAVPNLGRAWRVLVDAVADELEGRRRLWVLQAGAGTRPLFDLPEDAFLVGVDRDAWALERNVRLDQKVVADLTDYQPWATGFDLVTCWYVLDGLADPDPVLDRFTVWTAGSGLVVLGVTNPRSLRGLWLRMTRQAQVRASLTAAALRRRFLRAGFTPLLQLYFEDGHQARVRRRMKLTGWRWRLAQALTRLLTFGALDAARTDYIAVFRREE